MRLTFVLVSTIVLSGPLSLGTQAGTAKGLLLTRSATSLPVPAVECLDVRSSWPEYRDTAEMVFRGTVTAIEQTARYGERVSFRVDRVWMGSVPLRFDLYIWRALAESPRFEMNQTYVVVPYPVVWPREREGVGLGSSDIVAYSTNTCRTLPPAEAERTQMLRELGPGHPPDPDPGRAIE